MRLFRTIALYFLAITISWVVVLRFIPIWVTPLMVIRAVEQVASGKPIVWKHDWVSIDQISPKLPRAVIASEDNRFMSHWGFDFTELQKVVKDNKRGKRIRGGSTISQQTAKNVFLWPQSSWIRKGFECYFTVLIELLWSKERIMEVYLNSIEMGDGIYGAEAVALAHFHKTAARLTTSESALIAATLPNPRRYSSAIPSAYMRKRQSQIKRLMGLIGPIELFDKR